MKSEVFIAEVDVIGVERETDMAILVQTAEGQAWIPKSQIHEDSEVWAEGDRGILVIPEWLAEDKGLV